MVTPSRDSVVQELIALKAGLKKHMSHETIEYSGATYSAADVVAHIDGVLDAAANVRLARGALAGALADERRLRDEADGFLGALRVIILLRFKNAPATLAEFALEPRKKRRSATNEEKLVMAAKNRATRKERGTLGKRQKKAIHGNVTGVVITPVTKGIAKDGDPGEGPTE